MINLNKKKIKELQSIQRLNGSISISNLKSIIGNNTFNNKKNKFNFLCNVKKDENVYIISFEGKHFAKNVIQNRWHRGILLAYKKAIKTSAKNGFLKAMEENILPKEPLKSVEIEIEVYNPISRDDDANYDTLKWMRDTFTVNKLLEDDNRKVILNTNEKEVISKEWKIIFYVKNLSK